MPHPLNYLCRRNVAEGVRLPPTPISSRLVGSITSRGSELGATAPGLYPPDDHRSGFERLVLL